MLEYAKEGADYFEGSNHSPADAKRSDSIWSILRCRHVVSAPMLSLDSKSSLPHTVGSALAASLEQDSQRPRRRRVELKLYPGLLLGDGAGISRFTQQTLWLLLHSGRREPSLPPSTGVGNSWPSTVEISIRVEEPCRYDIANA